MCSNYLSPDFDEIFENETNDLNNVILNDDHELWNNDLLNLNPNDFSFDPLNDNHLYDTFPEKAKCKILDFDSSLADFNHLLKESPDIQEVKKEPTNSVSSTYLTDESSHPSSINSSPVSNKVRKRSHATLDSGSERSYALYDELLDIPHKATKVELIKSSLPNKIYKLTKDVKCEPIYINSLKIRQGNSSLPYVVHKLPSGIKTVNILPQKYTTERPIESLNNTFIRTPQASVQDPDEEFLSGDLYDTEVDHYSDYRSHSNGYYQAGYSSINQLHVNKTVFQPIPQAGPLHLTEEEKRTLLAEGYSIPTRMPLTKQDERNLKKVRRKIKNKISAQESRRKKKEYLDALEKKMESYEHERVENKRRIEQLENTQRSLYSQIRHLQQQLMHKVTGPGSSTSTGLMLFMVCFALLLVGGTMPSSSSSSSSYKHMDLPQNRLISGSSLYYMGYGMSRSHFNYSNQAVLQHDGSDYRLERPVNGQSGDGGTIMRRQSILLGDYESDDVNFENLVLSFTKNTKIGQQHFVTVDQVTFTNDSTFKMNELSDSMAIIDLIQNINTMLQ